MNFRTIVEPRDYDFEISYQSNLMLIGSCFSENIGEKLKDYKFSVFTNPNGILFNPKSISDSLNSIINEDVIEKKDLVLSNGLYHSLQHHGKFSGIEANKVLSKIKESSNLAFKFLKSTDVLLITFGTAWTYLHNETNKVVANCHKIPNKEFYKNLLSIDEIVEDYNQLILKIKKINPNINIIFTISPVRHWKDGATENMLSKSILNVAVHEICKKNDSISYFPSYEMLIDDLRDYRFYKEDMLHPNSLGVDYVWSGFIRSFFNVNTIDLLNKVKNIVQASNHKPLNQESESHQSFLKTYIAKTIELEKELGENKFEQELIRFKSQLV